MLAANSTASVTVFPVSHRIISPDNYHDMVKRDQNIIAFLLALFLLFFLISFKFKNHILFSV